MGGCFAGLKVQLRLPAARTLKDRRSIVQSVLQQARNRFGVSAADISDPLRADYAQLGFSFVALDETRAQVVQDRIEAWLEENGDGFELIAVEPVRCEEA